MSEEVSEMVTTFAKVHQYDERKTYKEEWEKWCDENNDVLNTEIRRLTDLGYDGNVIDKIYKAGRYYFRKKNTKDKKEPKQRRAYISMQNEVLEAMDEHIKNNSEKTDYCPASGFDDFCKQEVQLLTNEVNRICNNIPDINAKMLTNKIKKTYKNRYYLYSKQN